MAGYNYQEQLEKLAEVSRRRPDAASHPYEPYSQGVGALFNADLHRTDPDWSPRQDWIVLSAFEIEKKPEVSEARQNGY